jgi:hypothetical protein
MTVGVLNNSQNRDIIQLTVSEYNELLHRIETLEHVVIENRRTVLRTELACLEDGYKIPRTVKKRVR